MQPMFSALIFISYIISFFHKDINTQIQSKCRYENLSDKFIYEVSAMKKKDENRLVITDLYITIIDKSNNKTVQTIHRFGEDVSNVYAETFTNPIASRSYSTSFKKNIIATDGDYGDIVVVDFNFDGKEDFAVKKDIGREWFYDFYYQNNENKFVLDAFFSKENLGRFPKFDFDNKLVVYGGIVGAGGWWKKFYNYNSKSNRWVLIKSESGRL